MNPAAVLLPGFAGEALPSWLRSRLEHGLAGVCLFGGNVASADQLRRLTDEVREANPEAVIAVDEEGGDVTRLHARTGSPYPGNAILGRLDDPAMTEAVASAVGRELREAGVTLDLAPDADVNSTPLNPVIGVRSFGADAELVARHTAAWVRGLQSAGVAATVKHFPGHGDTVQDSHLAVPLVDLPLDELRARELVPFRAAVAAGARAVMSSHILLPQVDPEQPATFSATILSGLLRGELGFEGAVISDALDMVGAGGRDGIPAAAVRALVAGCDLLCLGTETGERRLREAEEALAAALDSGALTAERLADAQRRVRELNVLPTPAAAPADASGPDLDAVIRAFDVRPGVRVSAERTLVMLETEPNIAVGVVPWGPAAAGAAAVQAREGRRPELTDSAQPVLVGKDNHRHPWVRDCIDAVRDRFPSALVVDMGWPGEDRRYADVATFGASRQAGQALLAWLEGTAR
ncbi:glycoside hydrolase family 3 protein [Naasia sp. SYSU D00057]|uniref:glycoside hydrolase family 3 protein n=1 Tax=Naasia sp. SYSU D00057 TaxID=2817380 RepID=UPI001B30EBBD|nr:glycoside hydrolase family 3 protein [Naasia sp. SYSU D00057]